MRSLERLKIQGEHKNLHTYKMIQKTIADYLELHNDSNRYKILENWFQMTRMIVVVVIVARLRLMSLVSKMATT
jgi:hypothetical protein